MSTAEDLAAENVRLREALEHVVGYCFEVVDQTIGCPECGAVWWTQHEDINENWHAPGCKVFAAQVMAGTVVDVRRDPPPEPSPETRTPAQILRCLVTSAWFQCLARISREGAPPEGMDRATFERAVWAAITQLQALGTHNDDQPRQETAHARP